MVKSMTGYGKAVANLETGHLTIEIRTLNSKSSDINFKSSLIPKDREIALRQKIASALVRGTIDVYINWEPNVSESAKKINFELAKEYFDQICHLSSLLGISAENQSIIPSILRMPDVIDSQKQDIITDDNWSSVDNAFDEALASVNEYRSAEGAILYKDVTSRVANILELENEVESHESERVESVRARILKNLDDLSLKPDKERLEQEMVFYLEKLDINEEKVRLRQHCKYFLDTIDSEEYPGKKLGFIIQEMGREINTTGSKANHVLIQQAVVRMKDELEKIREQSMNIL